MGICFSSSLAAELDPPDSRGYCSLKSLVSKAQLPQTHQKEERKGGKESRRKERKKSHAQKGRKKMHVKPEKPALGFLHTLPLLFFFFFPKKVTFNSQGSPLAIAHILRTHARGRSTRVAAPRARPRGASAPRTPRGPRPRGPPGPLLTC